MTLIVVIPESEPPTMQIFGFGETGEDPLLAAILNIILTSELMTKYCQEYVESDQLELLRKAIAPLQLIMPQGVGFRF